MIKKYTLKRFNGKEWVNINPQQLTKKGLSYVESGLKKQSLHMVGVEGEHIIVEQLDKESKVK